MLQAKGDIEEQSPRARRAAYETHKPGLVAGKQNLTKMFHVKHFCPIAAQNLASRKHRLLVRFVRSVDFLVQKKLGGGGASMMKHVAGSQLRCKIHSFRGWHLNRPNRCLVSSGTGI
jgi:hypothetical protein